MAKNAKPVEAGDPVSFRLPVNTPAAVLDHLTELKISGDFGKECSRVFINAFQEKINHSPRVTLELPELLPVEKQQWLENKESQRVVGKWLFQLLTQDTVVQFESTIDNKKEEINMPAPVQNLFRGIMAGMDDD